jgi:nucleoside-diphosphate-sugar epimerase
LSLEALLKLDLDYICAKLAAELAEMSGRTLLITGGAGFLGYYFTLGALHWNKLNSVRAPIKVVTLDNFRRGVPAWLESVKSDPHLTLRTDDISKPLANDFVAADYIIHAAGIASPPFYRRWPLETIDANINGLRGFLFMSSSEIYGDPPARDIPTPEDFRGIVSCTGPRACYDESKRFGETICVIYAQQFGLPVRMARPFNNYGPGLKITDRRVLPDFMHDVLSGRDIVMLSDGSPTRTFCYVADAVVGYYKALVRGRAGEPYNVGTERPEVSMGEVANKVVELGRRYLGYGGQVQLGVADEKDYLVDNPNRRCPVIDKARKELGYEPGVGLDEGLYRLLSWYTHNRVAEEA